MLALGPGGNERPDTLACALGRLGRHGLRNRDQLATTHGTQDRAARARNQHRERAHVDPDGLPAPRHGFDQDRAAPRVRVENPLARP